MPVKARRVLSVAARSGRLGFVLLTGETLASWGTSEKGAKDIDAALERLHSWVVEYDPDVLITEDPERSHNKGKKQRAIMQAFLSVAKDWSLEHHIAIRQAQVTNLYKDAAEVAKAFPELADQVPEKPPIWTAEPYRLVYFEALVLARDAGFIGVTDAEGAASPGD